MSTSRNGPINSNDGKRWIGPYWNFNLSSHVNLTEKTSLGLTLNNLLGSIREDRSGGWPNYKIGSYIPYGRQAWIELSHQFDF